MGLPSFEQKLLHDNKFQAGAVGVVVWIAAYLAKRYLGLDLDSNTLAVIIGLASTAYIGGASAVDITHLLSVPPTLSADLLDIFESVEANKDDSAA